MRLPPVALGGIFGVAAAAALSVPAGDALRDLRAARLHRATLAGVAAGPPPTRAIVIDGAAIPARDAGAAADTLAATLRTAATRGGLLVESATPAPSAGLARVRLLVSGSEAAVIGFADAVERGRPIARFASWDMTARGGTVTLSGEVVAPWQ